MASYLPTFTVSRDDRIYEAFPDVVSSQNDKLICVYSECSHHSDRSYTRLMLIESDDRGRTWHNRRPLSAASHGLPYWDCARISKLPDQRLVVVCNRMYADNEQGGVIFIWFGDAKGEHWSKPAETPARGLVPDRLLVTASGRWLLTAHERSLLHGFLEQKLWYSDDQGQTWSDPVIVASQKGLHLCEASIIALPGDHLVAVMRENSGQGFDAYKAVSNDQGLSWQGVYAMPIPGCHRPVAGMLNNGQVLLTYRFMQGGKGWLGCWTQNFFAALTDVASMLALERHQQWSRILPIDFDRSPQSDLGYSGWIQFDDGEIYIVNYIMDDAPKAQIRGYSLTMSDFVI